jgi:hypothetical protein
MSALRRTVKQLITAAFFQRIYQCGFAEILTAIPEKIAGFKTDKISVGAL